MEESETAASPFDVKVNIEVTGHKSEDGRTSADIEREQEEARRAAVEADEETD